MPASALRKTLSDLLTLLFFGLMTLTMAGATVHYARKWLTLNEPNGTYKCISPNGGIMTCASGEAANRNATIIFALTSIGLLVLDVCGILLLRLERRSAKEAVECVDG